MAADVSHDASTDACGRTRGRYEAVENDHGWKIGHLEGCTSKLNVTGEDLEMVQFHVHTPSENTLNGRYAHVFRHRSCPQPNFIRDVRDERRVGVAVRGTGGEWLKRFRSIPTTTTNYDLTSMPRAKRERLSPSASSPPTSRLTDAKRGSGV